MTSLLATREVSQCGQWKTFQEGSGWSDCIHPEIFALGGGSDGYKRNLIIGRVDLKQWWLNIPTVRQINHRMCAAVQRTYVSNVTTL